MPPYSMSYNHPTPGNWSWEHQYKRGTTEHLCLKLITDAPDANNDNLVCPVREDFIAHLNPFDAHMMAAAPRLADALADLCDAVLRRGIRGDTDSEERRAYLAAQAALKLARGFA